MTDGVDPVALRYARGELSPAAAAAFEDLLAMDQAACDRLVRAVQADGPTPAGPCPTGRYRAAVRRRVLGRPVRVARAVVACALAVVLAAIALAPPEIAVDPALPPPAVADWDDDDDTWDELALPLGAGLA